MFSTEPEQWVLKGATAMLARLGGQARHTRNIDLLNCAGSLSAAERSLRAAVAIAGLVIRRAGLAAWLHTHGSRCAPPRERDLPSALATAKTFIVPVLAGTARGR